MKRLIVVMLNLTFLSLLWACSDSTQNTPTEAQARETVARTEGDTLQSVVEEHQDVSGPSPRDSGSTDSASADKDAVGLDGQERSSDAWLMDSVSVDVEGGEADISLPLETGPGLGIDDPNPELGVRALYEPDSNDWSAVGWPNDIFRNEDGSLDLSNFPNPDVDLLTDYLSHGMEVLDGFGLNGSIYFQFDGPIDIHSLPAPAMSTDPLAVAQLVNATPESERYGQLVPVEFHGYAEGDDDYYLPHTLAIRPVFGMPLAEGETYCALLTRGIQDADGYYVKPAPLFQQALNEEPTLKPLLDWLSGSPLHSLDVAAATCFTTQKATAELRAVRDFLENQASPEVALMEEPVVYGEFHGIYHSPNFQAGEKPYLEDGDLKFDDQGDPVIQLMEEMRFMLLLPKTMSMPESGWPVVLYAHGTGGDYESCRGVSDELLPEGLAILCIDQPLHGSRHPEDGPLTQSELATYSFNFLNGRAGRMSFRQSAIDTLVLTRMVSHGRFDLNGSETFSGLPLVLDTDRLFFFGHSHGGLSGAIVVGIDPYLKAAVISGAGGGLINTILLRKDPIDIKSLVAVAMGIDPKILNTFHPVLTLVQMLVDATDPVNYARFWLTPDIDMNAKHVFVTEGTGDHATPGITTETLTAAAGLPLINPLSNLSLAHELKGLQTVEMPVSSNVNGNGQQKTAASKQWEGGSHWVAFGSAQAEAMWLNFLRTARDGDPVIGIGEASLYTSAHVAGGDGCDGAGIITQQMLPATLVGNTSLANDHYAAVNCPGAADAGALRRDIVWRFTPEITASYRFHLSRPLPIEDEDDPVPTGPNQMYVVNDCDDVAGTCVEQSDDDTFYVDLEQGITYYLIIDGSTADHHGPFYVDIRYDCEVLDCGERVCGSWGCGSCGECTDGFICEDGQCISAGLGDLCTDSLPISNLPFDHHGNTQDHSNGYAFSGSDCPNVSTGRGATSSDVTFDFDVPSTGRYVFSLDADFDGALYVVSDCTSISETCLGAQRKGGAGERLHLSLETGQHVFVIVDGASNTYNNQGPYTLKVAECVPDCKEKLCGDDGCGGECGDCEALEICVTKDGCEPISYICLPTSACEALLPGDTCDNPLLVDTLPYAYGGDNQEDFYGNYSFGDNECPGESTGRGKGSNDVVHLFTPEQTAIYHIRLSGGFDSTLYVASDCDNIGGTCLGADQVKKKSGEELFVTLETGAPVYIFVDGASNTSNKNGVYTLKIDPCAPDCEDKVCGSDTCGGSCGSCAGSETCTNGVCQLKAGHSCEDPIKVGQLSWDDDENTYNFGATYSNPCDPDLAESSSASPDVLYLFTPTTSADYRIKVDADFDAQIYLLDACGDEGATCIGSTEAGDGPAPELVVGLEDDIPVYIIIDGDTPNVDGVGGSYEMTIEKICVPDCDGKTCGTDGCGNSCGTCEAPTDLCQEDDTCKAPADLLGNTCENPFVLDPTSLPFSAHADTSLALNHYGFGTLDCPGYVGMGNGSSEQVWMLTAEQAGTYIIELIPDDFDALLYGVKDCWDIQNTCVVAEDTRGNETIALLLEATETVYVIVDGTSNSEDESGSYELRIHAL